MTVFSKILAAAALAALCCSCTNPSAASNGPRATVSTRDGNRFSGVIVESSPGKTTLLDDAKVTHEFAAEQIQTITYDAPPAAGVNAALSATPASAPSLSATGVDPAAPATQTHSEHYHPPQAVIHTKTYLLPIGTQISARTEDTIDSGKTAEGQTYAAEIARDVTDANGDVVIPRGSNGVLVIRSAAKGGRIRGSSDLQLDLQSVSVEGQEYLLDTDTVSQQGRDGVGRNKRTAIFAGGGSAVGAIIGAIAGGGKGAAIGAGAGAGGGALTQILTKGGSIKVPAETILTFRLEQPLRVVAAR